MITKSQIKYIRSLHQKKYRELENIFFAEGLKVVNEALDSNVHGIRMLFYTPGSKQYLRTDLIPDNIPCIEVKHGDFQKISILKNPQGVLILLEKPSNHLPELSSCGDLIILLDGIQDPGNLGTIIRLADWFDIRQIVCSDDSVECFNPKVVQATMGAIFRVNISYTSLLEFLPSIRNSGLLTIYGSTLNGENIYTKELKTPAAVILGNEAHGISPGLHEYIHEHILIPNFSNATHRTESLNISIASAILCSEFRRTRTPDHSK